MVHERQSNPKKFPILQKTGIAVLIVLATALADAQNVRQALSVNGYVGQASVTRVQGRLYVDLEELARITDGSLAFEKDRIILNLFSSEPDKLRQGPRESGFSREFRRAAIEAMASIREWGGTLMVIVQTGYPVEKAMAGDTITAHQSRAGEAVAMAATAASTDDDYRGLELLKNEFNNVQDWSERFVKARSSLSAASLTMSEDSFTRDEAAQKTIRCGQFLAQMFAGNTFQDESSCH